ncbi:hypothetical protein BP5796_02803 [Coleophoma crateriformis]|uniref:Peptidase S33 tripeptidyl aminopeptidase-like C-terminal domain-containing protein n=1 Tax=Coleophoma crateriformis TaxID=565419 RepID=A0A3D8T0V5_9HELO|nr:hypothetical protein BP5796_02803 [Coleophoma crateriformis]
MLTVPLDYSKPTGNEAIVPLIKLAASTNSSTGPYAGMILTNPGGPGNSGVDSVLTYGGLLQSLIGSNYDIVAFDPRGIGRSIPLANCSATSTTQRRSAEISGPDFGPSFLNSTLTSAIALGEECEATIGGVDGVGTHMTTAINARDMISIVDAFARTVDNTTSSNSSLVNYWGFSYGSLLGQTFASMFPDRVGRFVLDGVVDTDAWLSALGTSSLNFTDQAFASFFDSCHLAGPQNCSYYIGSTRDDIYNRFEKTFNFFDAAQEEAQNVTSAPLIETALENLKTLFDESTYYPITFYPILSDVLVSLEAAIANFSADAFQNIELQLEERLSTVQNVQVSVSGLSEWYPAVACTDADGSALNMSLIDIEQYVANLRDQSIIEGEIWSELRIQCSKWPITSQDRFSGPFGGVTKTPMLFVSNTIDPATPIANGQKSVKNYAGARLLTIDGVGHSSLGPLNSCAFQHIATYFQTGVLPSSNMFCSIEAGAFGVTLTSNSSMGWKTNTSSASHRRRRLVPVQSRSL